MTRVELLYFDGCRNHERLHQRLRELLATHDVRATIEVTPVRSDEEARARRFLGSPTLRIDGADVEPGADARNDFGLKCRLFLTPEGLRGVPADEWVLAALELREPTRARAQARPAGAEDRPSVGTRSFRARL